MLNADTKISGVRADGSTKLSNKNDGENAEELRKRALLTGKIVGDRADGFTKLARKSDGEDVEELMKYVFTMVMEMVLRDLTKSCFSRKFVWRLDDFVISAICYAERCGAGG